MQALKSVAHWQVTGAAHSRVAADLIKIDLTDLTSLPPLLDSITPDIIIHSAAERRPDVTQKNPQSTRILNVESTAAIARWAAANQARLLYISTDYVFDGTNPPYREDAPVNPLNDYGRSKLDGERAVAELCPDYTILRVPILYGSVESLEESAVTTLTLKMLDAKPDEKLIFEDWATRYPTLTDDIADVLRQMLLYCENKAPLNGIYHWSADEAMTKYEMARVMAQCVGLRDEQIIPDKNPPSGAPRPHNSQLDTTRLRALGISKLTPFKEAIHMIMRKKLSKTLLTAFVTGVLSLCSATAQTKPLFNGKDLSGWRMADLVSNGEVIVLPEGVVECGAGTSLTGIVYTNAFPVRNYELSLEAMRKEGSDFFIGLTIPVESSYCTVIIGGWGGGLCGISSFEGNDAANNQWGEGLTLQNGRWYKLKVRVTPNVIQIALNDDLYTARVEYEECSQLGLRSGEIEETIPMGLSTYETTALWRNFTVTRITELRPEDKPHELP